MGAITALWLSTFSAILFIGMSVALEFKFTKDQFKVMIPTATVRVVNLCLSHASLTILPVGVVVSINALSSLMAICVFAPLRGESLSKKGPIYGAISLLGVFLITRTNLHESLFVFDIRLLLPIAAMLTNAYSTVLWRDSTSKIHPIQNLAILHSITATLALPVVIILSSLNSQAIRPNGNTLALFAIIAFAAIGDGFFLNAQKNISLTTNGVMIPTKLVFSSIFAFILIGQNLQWWQCIGIGIVVVSVSMGTVASKKISYKESKFELVEPASSNDGSINQNILVA